MNIINEKVTELTQELRIEISKDDYAEKLETELKKQRQKTVVPGFRPGNVPMGMVKKMYYKHLLLDELNNKVYESLYGYFKENNIDILLEPIPVEEKTIVDIDNSENFVFTFEYSLLPQIEISYEKITPVKFFNIKASEKEIKNYIDQIRKRYGKFTNPDSVEFDDDYITIEFEGDENEKAGFLFSELNDNGKKIFSSNKLNKSFNLDIAEIFNEKSSLAKLLKIKEEELDETNKYPSNIAISSIGRVELAELNEDFFTKAFPNTNVKNEKDMISFAESEIEKKWKEESEKYFINDAITILINEIPIDLPVDFIKKYLLLNNKELTAEKMNAEFDDMVKSFKWQLIENKILKDNSISVTEDDIKEYVRDYFISNYFAAFNYDNSKEHIDKLVANTMKNKESVKKIYDSLMDKKIAAALKEKLPLKEKSGDFDAFISFVSNSEKNEKENNKTTKPATKKSPASKKIKSDITTSSDDKKIKETVKKTKTTK